MENDLISIGKRNLLGLDVQQKPAGWAGKKASIDAEEGCYSCAMCANAR